MKHVKRGFCVCCGEQRDEHGVMTHDFECLWYQATDIDYINTDDNEQIKIFCPYYPSNLGSLE